MRPVPVSFRLFAEPGSDLEKQIEDWVKFGAPLQQVPAQDVRLDLPGGFSADGEAIVSVGLPAFEAPGTPVTMRLLEDDGTLVTSLDFVTEDVTTGYQQQGLRTVGHDMPSGLIRYEIRASMDDRIGSINFAVEDPTGRLPADMLPAIRFLSTLRPPRQIQLFLRNGPALTPPWLIPQTLMLEPQGRLWLNMCESLATIQEHVLDQIPFPDMGRFHRTDPMGDVETWYQAARLLRGEVLTGTWSGVGLHLNPGQEPPTGVQQGALFNNPYSVRIGGRDYPLGVVTMQVATVRVDETRPPVRHGDHLDVQFVPGDDATMTIRLNPAGPGMPGIPASVPSSS